MPPMSVHQVDFLSFIPPFPPCFIFPVFPVSIRPCATLPPAHHPLATSKSPTQKLHLCGSPPPTIHHCHNTCKGTVEATIILIIAASNRSHHHSFQSLLSPFCTSLFTVFSSSPCLDGWTLSVCHRRPEYWHPQVTIVLIVAASDHLRTSLFSSSPRLLDTVNRPHCTRCR
jgi:hypothetical protein